MTCADEEWVAAAMTDDAVVVALLVRLHHAPMRPPPKPPLEWSVRQHRSKKKAHGESPTAPLSWSGGATSLSGGSGGGTTSLAARRAEATSSVQKTGSKRSRKKKNLAELKEEEHSLIKERKELKREIAATRMNLENQRSINEGLKRMKLELPPPRELTSLPILPDLNMPFDEVQCSDVFCGAR